MDNTAITIEEAKETMSEDSVKKLESTPTITVLPASPVEEETTEGFVLDVIEGDDETPKPEKVTPASKPKDDYDDRFFGRPKTEEEYLAESSTLSYKIKDFLSWMVIAILMCIMLGLLIWHYS